VKKRLVTLLLVGVAIAMFVLPSEGAAVGCQKSEENLCLELGLCDQSCLNDCKCCVRNSKDSSHTYGESHYVLPPKSAFGWPRRKVQLSLRMGNLGTAILLI